MVRNYSVMKSCLSFQSLQSKLYRFSPLSLTAYRTHTRSFTMGRPSKKRQVEEDPASSDGEISKPIKKAKTKATKEADSGKDDEGNSFWSVSQLQ